MAQPETNLAVKHDDPSSILGATWGELLLQVSSDLHTPVSPLSCYHATTYNRLPPHPQRLLDPQDERYLLRRCREGSDELGNNGFYFGVTLVQVFGQRPHEDHHTLPHGVVAGIVGRILQELLKHWQQ